MDNCNILLIFFTVYREFCDEENLSENSGDTALFVTESFDYVHDDVKRYMHNHDTLTAKVVMDSVKRYLIDSMRHHIDNGTFTGYASYINELYIAYNDAGFTVD